jgi:uncharacterized protein (DUF433 family)
VVLDWYTSILAYRHGFSIGQGQPVRILDRLSRDRYTVAMNYKDRITIEPGKRGGQPCIRGMRITVYDVLSYLASGMTQDEILADFSYLMKEDILACLGYAADRESYLTVISQ